jgi:methanogenic corrinoid protein MtbC1
VRTSWEAPALASVTAGRDSLARTAMGSLGGPPSRGMLDLVEQRFAALDAGMAWSVPELLADHLAWERARLQVLAPRKTSAHLDTAVRAALSLYLSGAELARTDEFCRTASRQPARPEEAPLDERSRAYLDHLVHGDRTSAIQVVTDALDSGVPPGEVMLGVLQPAQLELGRLWQEGRINVAHEHYCTAVTQVVMTMLYPRLFEQRSPRGRRVVVTAVGEESHEVGLRMVTDLLDRAGWRTAYLGTGIPVVDVLDHLTARPPDVLALGITMPGHLPALHRLVDAVRAEPSCAHVRIVVGGRLLQVAPRLADGLGADGSARDAEGAVRLCASLPAPT